jgi:hypothetical protein
MNILCWDVLLPPSESRRRPTTEQSVMPPNCPSSSVPVFVSAPNPQFTVQGDGHGRRTSTEQILMTMKRVLGRSDRRLSCSTTTTTVPSSGPAERRHAVRSYLNSTRLSGGFQRPRLGVVINCMYIFKINMVTWLTTAYMPSPQKDVNLYFLIRRR